MPTQINQPFIGLKHSETPTISVVGGDELVQAIRPQAADPAKFENVNVPVALLGGNSGAGAQAISLADAQALSSASGVKAGAAYTITSPIWNGSTPATVYVHGLNATEFAPYGSTLDANDVLQPVRVNVAAGTVDTRPLRDLQLLVVKVDEVTGDFVAWVGQDIAPGWTIEERQIP